MDSQQFDQSLNESLEFYGKVREEKGISITSLTREVTEGLVIYTAVGKRGERTDSATGAVSIEGLKGLEKADAFKAAETQAKSRLTISLSGVRIERAPSAPEPAALDAPTVNNDKAEVVPTLSITLPIEKAHEIAKQILEQPVLVPRIHVTEEMISKIHEEAEVLSVSEPAAAKLDPAVPIAVDGQNSIFDEEPDVLVAPTPLPVPKPEPVDAVLAAVQPTTATDITMPIPIPKPADQPTRLQFQGYTIRCSKIVRGLNAAGKDAPSALMPYLRKIFGTKELSPETTSILLWESTLTALETAGSPAATFKILKGGN